MKINKHFNKYINKNFSIPTKILDLEDYVEYYNKIYTSLYDDKIKNVNNILIVLYKEYKNYFSDNSEEHFINYINNFDRIFTDFIIEKIKSTEFYNNFNNNVNIKKDIILNGESKTLYNPKYLEGEYISIDLVSANFQSLKTFDKNILFGAEKYNEFIKKMFDIFLEENQDFVFINESLTTFYNFCDLYTINKNKRQVLFGHFNPKKQQIIEYNIIISIFNLLKENNFINSEKDIIVINNDEIIFRKECFKNINGTKIIELISSTLGIDIHFENFKLNKINGFQKNYYVKEFLNNLGEVKDFVFKDLPKNKFLDGLKTYYRNNLFIFEEEYTEEHEYDTYFVDGETNLIAKFIK